MGQYSREDLKVNMENLIFELPSIKDNSVFNNITPQDMISIFIKLKSKKSLADLVNEEKIKQLSKQI